MTQRNNEAASDGVDLEDTAAMTRVVTMLDAVCAPTAPSQAVRLDAAVTHALHERTATHLHRPNARRPQSLAWVRLRLAALAALVVIAGAGAVAYLTGQSPAPVSAQTVLSRAAAAGRLAPHGAAHLTYILTPGLAGRGGGVAGPLDVWLQADVRGNMAHLAITFKIYRDNGALAAIQRMVFAGGNGEGYVYDPGANAVALIPATIARQPSLGGLALFDPSAVAAYLARVAQGTPGKARLLPQQTLDGASVDTVQVPGNPRHDDPPVTAYFDAQSYLFRGMDVVSGPYTLRLRVMAYRVVAASAVPRRTFALGVPSTARVVANVAVPEFIPGD